MISLDKKKRMEELLFGIVLMIVGLGGMLIEHVDAFKELKYQRVTDNTVGFIITIILMFIIFGALFVSIRYSFKKLEPEDEMSDRNTYRAKFKVYGWLIIFLNIYCLGGIFIPYLVIDKYLITIISGACLSLEYWYFHKYESKGDFND